MKKHLLSLLFLVVITTSLCKAQIFYGMTLIGGSSANSYGAIISFNAATNKESVVWNLAGAPSDGATPYGNLVYDSSNGLFYGMTYYGGSNDTANGGYGTIISFNPITNKDSLVWSFAGYPSDGESPFGDLFYDAVNGLFYGMTGGEELMKQVLLSASIQPLIKTAWFGTLRVSRMDWDLRATLFTIQVMDYFTG